MHDTESISRLERVRSHSLALKAVNAEVPAVRINLCAVMAVLFLQVQHAQHAQVESSE